MSRKRPQDAPSDVELSDALSNALDHSSPLGGATIAQLVQAIRIGWGLDVTPAQVGHAMTARLLAGAAERAPNSDGWPRYRPRQARRVG